MKSTGGSAAPWGTAAADWRATMAKPLIALTPQHDTENGRVWMRENYMEAVAAAGGIPVILPLADGEEELGRMAEVFDAFLFTGGPDVLPAVFGEETMRGCGAIDPARDAMELALLQRVCARNKPVLGICRGIQLINVALGGDLYQDIPAQAQGFPVLHSQQPPYFAAVHGVTVEPDSPLYAITGERTLAVNSMHHQAVRRLAPSLRCAASAKDGLAECVYMPGKKFFLAVQWHPEYLWKTSVPQQKIMRAFVEGAFE